MQVDPRFVQLSCARPSRAIGQRHGTAGLFAAGKTFVSHIDLRRHGNGSGRRIGWHPRGCTARVFRQCRPGRPFLSMFLADNRSHDMSSGRRRPRSLVGCANLARCHRRLGTVFVEFTPCPPIPTLWAGIFGYLTRLLRTVDDVEVIAVMAGGVPACLARGICIGAMR